MENLKNNTSGLPQERYSREKLLSDMSKLKESGSCPMSSDTFYTPWNLVEFGSDEYEKTFSVKKFKK